MPDRLQWIDVRCAPRRQVAGQRADGDEDGRHAGARDGIAVRHVEEQRAQDAVHGDRRDQSDGHADSARRRPVAALRSRLQVMSRVLRDGRWQLLPARELVPGNVVRVRIGDFVQADVRVLDGNSRVDQSALTGES